MSKDRVEEFLAVQTPQIPPRVPQRCRWSPPPPGFVKINVDGAVFSDTNSAGVGTVIRNREGLVMTSHTQRFSHAYSPVVIEALAALHGLQLARDLGFTNAVLEGDFLRIMSALQSGCEVPSPAGLFIDEARHSSQFFSKITLLTC